MYLDIDLFYVCGGWLGSRVVSLLDSGTEGLAEWLACWTQAQKGLGSNRSRDADG